MATMSSINVQDAMVEDIKKAHAILWHQSLNFIKSMSLKCAIELRIPDAIHHHGMPTTISDLLSSLSIPKSKSRGLCTLMCILSQEGIFKSHITLSGEEAFSLTHVSRLLISSSTPYRHLDNSPFILLSLDHHFIDSYQQLSRWFHRLDMTTTPFEMAHGKTFWELTRDLPKFGDMLNKAMVNDSRIVAYVMSNMGEEMLKGVGMLVDVGGGTGLMAIALVEAFPGLECIVLDLPHVISNIEKKTDMIQFIAGDMFVEVPPAHVALLKWVLHNWNDEECIKILKCCKEAIPPKEKGGKVIIIDMVGGHGLNTQTCIETKLIDLYVMTLFKGKERDEGEWHKIFVAAGFSDYKITSSIGLRSIIEVYP